MRLASDVAAWAAVVVSAAGGLLTTAIHYGKTNAQLEAIQRRQDDVDGREGRQDDRIVELQKQTAAINQNLTDIHDTVHDIQNKVSTRK